MFRQLSIFLILLPLYVFFAWGESIPRRGNWPLGLEPDFEIPIDNPLTEEKVELGKWLFFDKQLSFNHTVSCATCHIPEKGFSNGLKVAKGVSGQNGYRNVPSLVNRLYGITQFWDGRVETLESQALKPIFNPDEMAMNETLLLQRLKADPTYQNLFYQAFGTPEPTVERISKALASFQRTLITGETAFDQYEWNGNQTALSASAKRGIVLFRGKARCSTCHVGTNFTDESFHNLGAGEGIGRKDPGRATVTGNADDFGKFKTPTLRNIEQTAPYMHDGSFVQLEDVIEFYNQGGNPNPNLDKEIKPIGLTESEKADLLAFLKSLTAPVFSAEVKVFKAIAE